MAALKPCSFNRIAPFYPTIEVLVFGAKLTRARNAALALIPANANILLLGEGNGRFLTELLTCHPQARVTCVEPSAGMRAAQRKRLLKRLGKVPENLIWIDARIQDWSAPESRYDAIVAHFFFDLFSADEIDAVVAKVTRAATPSATLFVAEFESLPSRWSGLFSRLLIRTMYLFFALATKLKTTHIPPWPQALQHSGWTRQSSNDTPAMIRAHVWIRIS